VTNCVGILVGGQNTEFGYNQLIAKYGIHNAILKSIQGNLTKEDFVEQSLTTLDNILKTPSGAVGCYETIAVQTIASVLIQFGDANPVIFKISITILERFMNSSTADAIASKKKILSCIVKNIVENKDPNSPTTKLCLTLFLKTASLVSTSVVPKQFTKKYAANALKVLLNRDMGCNITQVLNAFSNLFQNEKVWEVMVILGGHVELLEICKKYSGAGDTQFLLALLRLLSVLLDHSQLSDQVVDFLPTIIKSMGSPTIVKSALNLFTKIQKKSKKELFLPFVDQIFPVLMENTNKDDVMQEAFTFLNQLETLANHVNTVLSLIIPVLGKNSGLYKNAEPILFKILEDVGNFSVMKDYFPNTTADVDWVVKLLENLDGKPDNLIYLYTMVIEIVKGPRIRTMCIQRISKILSKDNYDLGPREAQVILKVVTRLLPEKDLSDALSCFLQIIEKDDFKKMVNASECIPPIMASMRYLKELSPFPVNTLGNVAKALFILCTKYEEVVVLTEHYDVIEIILNATQIKQFITLRYFVGILSKLITGTKNVSSVASMCKIISLILQKSEAYFNLMKESKSTSVEDLELVSFVVDLVLPLCKDDQGRLFLIEEDIIKVLGADLFIHFKDYPNILMKLVLFYNEFSL